MKATQSSLWFALIAGVVSPAGLTGQTVATEVFAVGDGSSAVEFGAVSDVVQHAESGRVFVADAMDRSVTALSRDGGVEFSFGRPGRGPGEFANALGGLAIVDGSLVVADGTTLQRFTLDGEYVDRIPFKPENRVSVILTLDGGSGFVLVGTREASADGQHFGLYMLREGGTVLLERIPFQPTAGSPKGERVYWSVAGSRVLTTEPDSSAVVLTHPDGGVPLRVRVGKSARTYQRGDVRALKERLDAQCEASAIPGRCRRAADEALLALASKSGPVPPLGAVAGDGEGRWILGRADGPGDLFSSTYREFSLFDQDASVERRIVVPRDLRPMSFSDGVIWGVVLGPFDEPIVVGYRVADAGKHRSGS
ncbi:MAG: hypothetical protein RQ751_03870 [Longimicrobiales bacterium]|nr:hypothetical protein [Longimicrobiales bacterium]